jgi:hypothetical protein
MLDYEEMKQLLKTPLSQPGKRDPSYPKRRHNIFWIRALDRQDLEFGIKEKQILLHRTKRNEILYLQYPGKESSVSRSSRMPWDFRPKIYSPSAETYDFDMSFFDIWEVMFENAKWFIERDLQSHLSLLAILLYRMAYLFDHVYAPLDTTTRELEYITPNGAPAIHVEEDTVFPEVYKYSPNTEIIESIDSESLSWRGMSLEAFLHYNAALAWNEDCKYYYKENLANISTIDIKDNWMKRGTGRVNTLLTHIRIIGYIIGKVHLSNIFNDFNRKRGVCPALKDEILDICQDFIVN